MRKFLVGAFWLVVMTGMVQAATIKVTSPRTGEVVCHGRDCTVTWTSSGKVGRVMVRLMRSGTVAANLSPATANDGRFDFTVAATIPAGNYRIEVQNLNRTAKGESGSFQISPCAPAPAPPPPVAIMPQISITAPGRNSALAVGGYFEVKWRTVGRMPEMIHITLHQPDCSGAGINLSTVRASAGRQVVRIPQSIRPSSGQPIHLRAGEFRTSLFACVQLDRIHCRNIIHEPNSTSIWHPGETVVVRWSVINSSGATTNIYMGSERNIFNHPVAPCYDRLLARNIPNSGEARVTLPADLAPGKYAVSVEKGEFDVYYFGTSSDIFQVAAR